MKVLFVDAVKSPSGGGAGPHRYELIKNISNFVEVYCITEIDSLSDLSNINALSLNKRDYSKFCNKFTYLTLLFKLTILQKYNIIYIRNIFSGLIGYLIGKLTNSKIVFEVNSISKDEMNFFANGVSNSLKYKIKFTEIIELFLANNSDGVICVTDGIKHHLVENGVNSSKIIVINNGVDISKFKPTIQKTYEYKIKCGIKDNNFVVLFQGTLVNYQGVDHLIESSTIIINKIPNVMFIIIGDGIEYLRLVKRVDRIGMSKYFVFMGRVNYDEVPCYINLADVCVAPFIKERNDKIGLSPLKVFEYMACEKPVVISRIKGISHIVEKFETGVVVAPENSCELANGITQLLLDKDLRIRLGKNGRKICVDKYNWLNVAEETKDVFDSLTCVRKNGLKK